MLVFVPDHQQGIIQTSLMGFQKFLSFPIVVMQESTLFQRKRLTPLTLPYARQMAIKLLAAKKVRTEFYITLDADVILLRSFHVNDVLVMDNEDNNEDMGVNGAGTGTGTGTGTVQGKRCGARGLYEHEGRYVIILRVARSHPIITHLLIPQILTMHSHNTPLHNTFSV